MKKYSHILVSLSIVTLIALIIPSQTYAANWWDVFLDKTIGWGGEAITEGIKGAIGWAVGIVIAPRLNDIIQFSDFFSTGVNAAWATTRDFANLFFAIGLLFIAVSTVLNVGPLDGYSARRMLPNFILIALLINFSKAIVAIGLDISQIIMISFYNALGVNIVDTITSAAKLAETNAQANAQLMAINIAIIIMFAILGFVLVWTIVTLVVRIATIWICISTAPLAFVSMLFPPTKSLWNQWLQQLQEALVSGPVLMFMIYIALATLQGFSSATPSGGDFWQNGSLFNFILVIIMLSQANIYAQKAASQAPGALKTAANWLGSVGTFGLGAYVGAGGFGTGKVVQGVGEGIKNTVQAPFKAFDEANKGIRKGLQVGTGGALRTYDNYLVGEQERKFRQATGQDKRIIGTNWTIPLTGGFRQQLSEEGQKRSLAQTQAQQAEQTRSAGDLNDKPWLQKALAEIDAANRDKIKDESSSDLLIQQYKKSIENKDLSMARQVILRLSELDGGIDEFMKEPKFQDLLKQYQTEGDALNAMLTKDLDMKYPNQKFDRSYRSRVAAIVTDKKKAFLAEGLDTPITTAPTIYDPSTGAINTNNPSSSNSYTTSQSTWDSRARATVQNKNIFGRRKAQLNAATGNYEYVVNAQNQAEYDFDLNAFVDYVRGVPIEVLKDKKSWNNWNQNVKDQARTQLNSLTRPRTPIEQAILDGLS